MNKKARLRREMIALLSIMIGKKKEFGKWKMFWTTKFKENIVETISKKKAKAFIKQGAPTVTSKQVRISK